MRGLYFYGCITMFAIGVALASMRDASRAAGMLLLIVAAACMAFRALNKKTSWIAAALMLGGIGFGIVQVSLATTHEEANDAPIGQQVAIQGIITKDPVVSATNQKIILRSGAQTIIAFVPVYPAFAYGDAVIARGILKRPEAFTTDTGSTFDYPAYLAKEGIYLTLDKAVLEATGEWKGDHVEQILIRINHTFVASIKRSVPEPYAGFAAGVVLGSQNALSQSDEDLFRGAGLMHVVVVSGYNITLVGDSIARLLSFAPQALASFGSLAGIVLFILLTGASASAVRAGIMAALVLLARFTKRHYDPQRALFFAGFLMVVHTPAILLHDPSFQLSFLATWGLSSLTPMTQRWFAWIPFVALREIAGTTAATQLAVAPLLLYLSGTFSVLSLPANLLVLPMVPLLMAGALIIGMFGFLPTLLVMPFALVVQGISAYVFTVIRIINAIPHSVLHVPSVSLVALAIMYAALLGLSWFAKRNAPPSQEGGAVGLTLTN